MPAGQEAPRFPFVHLRRVRWGEADPARIAYTPRFLDFAMDAVEAFLQSRLDAGFYELNLDHGLGTPFVHVELDFRSPRTPRDTLATEVRLARLGGASTTYAVRGRVGDRLAFEGRLVSAWAEMREGRLTPVPVPERFRLLLQPDADFAAAERG